MALSPVSESSELSLLRHRPLAFYCLGRLTTSLAAQMQAVAVGWQVYELTDSAFDLGLVGLVQFLPFVILALLVGSVADRFDRRLILAVSRLTQGGAMATLAIGSALGWLSFEAILALVVVLGAARAFDNPVSSALLPQLVPRATLTRALAISASSNQAATIIGPAIGGLLYVLGPTTVYSVGTAITLLGGIITLRIRVAQAAPRRDPFTLTSLFGGIHFILTQRAILGAISLDLIGVLLGGATALLPIFARDILMTGPWGLGLLRSGPAIGALALTILMARYPLRRHLGTVMLVSVAVFGAATIIFAVSTSIGVSLVALTVLGAADSISVVVRQTLIQTLTPDGMRGRVSAVSSLFVGTSNLVGEFESGVTAAWFGAVAAVLIGGLGTLAVVLWWLRLFPELRRFDRLETS
ncbi:MAG: major Facilitator Superfamily protein [Rhodospirillales bacterium]|nr:major Facilitator Superfamily protein [Rhodospirillales bacterium]